MAKESSRDSSSEELLYCSEAIVAMMMQAYLVLLINSHPKS